MMAVRKAIQRLHDQRHPPDTWCTFFSPERAVIAPEQIDQARAKADAETKAKAEAEAKAKADAEKRQAEEDALRQKRAAEREKMVAARKEAHEAHVARTAAAVQMDMLEKMATVLDRIHRRA